MTRWRDSSKQVDRFLYIQPLLGVYCSAMDASSALNTCEYLTLFCACLWDEHHYSFCVFGVASQMKSVLVQTTLPHQLYTLGVACWEVTWPNDLQTRFCQYIGISPVAFQCTLGSKVQAHWIATGLPPEDHWFRVRVECFEFVPFKQLTSTYRLTSHATNS